MNNTFFSIGEIVTLKTHPLFKNHTIDTYSNHVPPLMLVKDITFEDKKKIFSDQVANTIIADNIKYTCIYFNNNKSDFEEVTIYQSFLANYEELMFFRKKTEDGKETISPVKLIEEVNLYTNAEYQFGGIVYFKTSKLESRKTFSPLANDNLSKLSYTAPDFILCGYKKESSSDLFYGDGKMKKQISECSFKVMWFNHFQHKISEQYLPKEFFVSSFDPE